MVYIQAFLIYSFIPVLIASLILFYFIIETPKKRKVTSVATLLIQANDGQILDKMNNLKNILQFSDSPQKQLQTSVNQTITNKRIFIQANLLVKKMRRSNLIKNIKSTNKQSQGQGELPNQNILKKGRLKHGWRIDPKYLPTIFEQQEQY